MVGFEPPLSTHSSRNYYRSVPISALIFGSLIFDGHCGLVIDWAHLLVSSLDVMAHLIVLDIGTLLV